MDIAFKAKESAHIHTNELYVKYRVESHFLRKTLYSPGPPAWSRYGETAARFPGSGCIFLVWDIPFEEWTGRVGRFQFQLRTIRSLWRYGLVVYSLLSTLCSLCTLYSLQFSVLRSNPKKIQMRKPWFRKPNSHVGVISFCRYHCGNLFIFFKYNIRWMKFYQTVK